jgi:hypothetical protein
MLTDRTTPFAWCACLLPALLAGCTDGGKTTPDPDYQAADATTKTFLTALRNRDGGSAYGMLSQDYRGRLSEEEKQAKAMRVDLVEGKPVAEWRYGPGKLSDQKDRATFEGLVEREGGHSEFTLLLVKEGGAWRVDLFTVKK